MNAATKLASALSQPNSWNQISWDLCLHRVRKLQIRIAKAVTDGKWTQVKRLQRLLVRSFAAKALSVKRVTENTGKNTPGIDKITWNTSEDKWNALFSLRCKGYKPLPLRRIMIPKSNGGKRPLGIPVMRDRAMQALWLLALEPVSETCADKNSYGFRPCRRTADAIAQVFNNFKRAVSAKWVLEGDIKGCFDHISHEWLLSNIPMDKNILKKWLRAGVMENGVFRKTSEGTPQGGIISPVLANMTLDGLESRLRKAFGKINSQKAHKHKVNYVRFADDFVISGISQEVLQQQVLPLVNTFMTERGLELSQEKTLITHIASGFDFLGQNIRTYKGKLLIKPAQKNLSNFLKKIKRVIDNEQSAPTWRLVSKLNPIIRGWANYHRHIAAKATFSKADHLIWQMLWRWCIRRHRNKGKRWVKRKYFTTIGGNNWMFYGFAPDGKRQVLIKAASTPIKRYVKIKAAANPYDSNWYAYLDKRASVTLNVRWSRKRGTS